MAPGTLLVLWLACVIIGRVVGSRKGRPVAGLLVSAALGPLGVLGIALMPKTQEKLDEEARMRLEAEENARQQMRATP